MQESTFEKLSWPEGPATLVSSPAIGQTLHNSTLSNPSQSTALSLHTLRCFGRAKDENNLEKKKLNSLLKAKDQSE